MTRYEQVADLMSKGMTEAQICNETGLKPTAVRRAACYARSVGASPKLSFVPKSTDRQRLQAYIQYKLGLKVGHTGKSLAGQPQDFIDFLITHQRGNETIADVLVKLSVDAKARRG